MIEFDESFSDGLFHHQLSHQLDFEPQPVTVANTGFGWFRYEFPKKNVMSSCWWEKLHPVWGVHLSVIIHTKTLEQCMVY